jgi:DNA-binding MarR family transcriptional regulator
VDSPRRLTQLPSWLLSEAARRGHALVSEGFAEEGVRKAHYVERTRDEHDRRRNVVALTADGVAALQRLNARADAAQDALLAALSPKERRELERLLARLL